MADQAINALSTKTAPETSDQLLLVGTGEPQLIDYDKLADAILNKITSKNYALDAGQMTLLAAINKLNSESKKSFIKDAGDYDYNQYTPKQAAEDIIDNKLNANSQIIQFIGFICASKYFMIAQKHTSDYCSYLLFGYAADNIAYHVKRNGKWE